MRLLVVGGSGRTGKLIIEDALEKGNTVTALVRNPSSLEERAGLNIVKGSPLSTEDIKSAFEATSEPPQAVITALNATRVSDSPFAKPLAPPRFLADSHANLLTVMSQFGVKRIVAMSAYGVGDSTGEISWIFRLLLRHSNMKYQFEDHDHTDVELKQSTADWTLVRPVILADDETKGKEVKDAGDLGKGVSMFVKVSRRSVAEFMVDAATEGKYVKRTPVIFNTA